MMKNDMSGGGAVFSAMLALARLGVPTRVTGYIMCTDNMPSGTAMKLGDVLTHRDGTTVEVVNTDAEGRLVMADALVMASELEPDAIVAIATLTGACMRALGTESRAYGHRPEASSTSSVPPGRRRRSRCGNSRWAPTSGPSSTPTWPT